MTAGEWRDVPVAEPLSQGGGATALMRLYKNGGCALVLGLGAKLRARAGLAAGTATVRWRQGPEGGFILHLSAPGDHRLADIRGGARISLGVWPGLAPLRREKVVCRHEIEEGGGAVLIYLPAAWSAAPVSAAPQKAKPLDQMSLGQPTRKQLLGK